MLELTGFAVFALSSSITPGPNNVLLTALGASVGLRRGLPALFGIAFGFAVMIFVISIGIGRVILEADPAVTLGMRLVGLSIIAWMAWQIATAPVADEADFAGDATPTPRLGNFLGAAAFQWVNPKAWMICASAIAAYLDITRDILPQATMLAATFVVAGLVGCLPWLAAGTLVGRFLKGRRARIFNSAMAVLLVASMMPALI
jgi:threonine/homoserine/homoserine lactone efflux protein